MLLECSTLSYDYGPLVYNDRTQWKCHAYHEFDRGSLHRIFQSIPLISLKLSFKSYHFDFASNLTFFRFRQAFWHCFMLRMQHIFFLSIIYYAYSFKKNCMFEIDPKYQPFMVQKSKANASKLFYANIFRPKFD